MADASISQLVNNLSPAPQPPPNFVTSYTLELRFGITLEEITKLNRVLEVDYGCNTTGVRLPQTFLDPIMLVIECHYSHPQRLISELTNDLSNVVLDARVATIDDMLESESWVEQRGSSSSSSSGAVGTGSGGNGSASTPSSTSTSGSTSTPNPHDPSPSSSSSLILCQPI